MEHDSPGIVNATWIALRRVTVQAGPPTKHDLKPTLDQSTNLSFTATKAENVYIMATQTDAPPAFAASGQFKEVAPGTTTLCATMTSFWFPPSFTCIKLQPARKSVLPWATGTPSS